MLDRRASCVSTLAAVENLGGFFVGGYRLLRADPISSRTLRQVHVLVGRDDEVRSGT
jgi:hypothetical protein